MAPTQNERIKGRRVLVVEDEYLVAETINAMLEDAGAIVVGPFGWCDDALAYIEGHDAAFDIALLDVNLHGQTSYAIADALVARGIGFVFTTGYASGVLSEAYRAYPRCEKPFKQQSLLCALASAIAPWWQLYPRRTGNGIGNTALHPDAVRRILAHRVQMAGIVIESFDRLSAHALRVGFITAAYDKGVRDEDIMRHTRHRDLHHARLCPAYQSGQWKPGRQARPVIALQFPWETKLAPVITRDDPDPLPLQKPSTIHQRGDDRVITLAACRHSGPVRPLLFHRQ